MNAAKTISELQKEQNVLPADQALVRKANKLTTIIHAVKLTLSELFTSENCEDSWEFPLACELGNGLQIPLRDMIDALDARINDIVNEVLGNYPGSQQDAEAHSSPMTQSPPDHTGNCRDQPNGEQVPACWSFADDEMNALDYCFPVSTPAELREEVLDKLRHSTSYQLLYEASESLHAAAENSTDVAIVEHNSARYLHLLQEDWLNGNFESR